MFTGHETKIMKNSVRSRAKFSKLEILTNTYIIVIIVIQLLLSLVASIVNTIWEIVYDNQLSYLISSDPNADKTRWYILFTQLGTWFLSLGNFVPISMLVTLECVKFFQASFINWDHTIYDTDKDMPAKAQSSNLNEELGTVQYVFSDKTGTLTQNVMEFRKFSAGSEAYGKAGEVDRAELKAKGITNVNFVDE